MDEETTERRRQKARESYYQNREARIAYAKAWNKANPEKCREYYKKSYYGMRKQQEDVQPTVVPDNPLLGPPVFIFHGRGQKITFD